MSNLYSKTVEWAWKDSFILYFHVILSTEWTYIFRLILDSNQIHLLITALYISIVGMEASLYELLFYVIKQSPTEVADICDYKTMVNHYKQIVRGRIKYWIWSKLCCPKNELIFIDYLIWMTFFTHITSLKYYKPPAKDGFTEKVEA